MTDTRAFIVFVVDDYTDAQHNTDLLLEMLGYSTGEDRGYA